MGTKDIFISYKAEEFDEAEWVRSTLEHNGISCWMAPECIAGGSNYAREIPKAIRECRVFVLILSEKSQGSQWVPRELDQAINEKKTIMPFMLENCALRDDFSFYLSNVQRYEAYANKSAAMEKMVREIRALIQAETQENASSGQKAGEQAVEREDEKKEPVPDPRQKDGKKPEKKTWPFIAAGGIAAVLVVFTIIMAGRGGAPKMDPEDPPVRAEDTEGQQPEAEEADPETSEAAAFRHIRLQPPDAMSIRDFHEAVEILKGRLEVLTDGAYEMEVGTECIDLTLPGEAFGTLDTGRVMDCYIARAIDLYGYSPNEDDSAVAGKFEIRRKDLEEVTLLHGAIDGVDPADYEVDTAEYPYVKIVLTDACASAHAEEIAAWGDKFTFGQDMESGNGWWSYYTFPEGDGRTFYVLNNDSGGNFSELLVYNLTHDALASGFYCLSDLNELAEWEDPSDAPVRGENQCRAEEMTGRSVTFTMNGYNLLTPGEWLDVQTALKERLDTLNQPYAFGKTEDREEKQVTIYIKTGVEHMGIPVMKILGAYGAVYSFSAQAGLLTVQGAKDFRINSKEDGTYEVAVDFPLLSGDEDENMSADVDRDAFREASEGGARLFLDTDCFLGNSRGGLSEEGTFTFDQLICLDNQSITEDNLWVAELMERLVKGTDLPCGFYLDQYWMNTDQDGRIAKESDFAISYASAVEDASDAVREAVPDAEVSSNGMRLYVSLKLDVDETLPEEGIRLMREIYERTDFEKSIFQTLWFYLVEEDNASGERARVYFDKSCSFHPEEAKVVYGGMFTNGRLDAYKEKFKALIEADPFYIEREDRSEWGGFRYEWN